MSNSFRRKSLNSLKIAVGLSTVIGAIPLAYADNQISLYTDTAPAGDNILVGGVVDAAIGTDGVIANSTGHATGTIPTFALDLGRSNVSTTNNGAYTFAAAFTVYAEDDTDLRLEFYIPSFTLNFASGEASLSFPGGNATVYGRDDTGSLAANATITNSMFSNPSNQLLQLDVESQLTALAGSSAGLFDEIANVIKSDGVTDYVYRVFLKQTGGPAKLNLGTGDAETDSANFTAFTNCPTSAELATEFLLNTGLATTFDGAYALLGNLAFGAGGLTNVNTAFTGTGCAPFTPSSGGGGGGGGGGGSSSSSSGASADVAAAETSLQNVTDFSNLDETQLEVGCRWRDR